MVDACVERLKPLMPISILALNEVDVSLRPHALARLSDALGLSHSEFFGHVRNGEYGNALLSAAPITHREEHVLDGGSVVRFGDRTHQIVRGMLTVRTTLGGVPVGVGVTHLDHMAEAERIVQSRHVIRALLPDLDAAQSSPHLLLLGDLNALSRADYSAAEWAEHVEHNAQRGWAAPSDSAAEGGCLGCLGLFRAAGFDDCVRRSMQTASGEWRVAPWSAHVHTVGSPRYRIDYVLSRSGGAAGSGGTGRLRCVSARVENVTDDCGASSDHCPVAVDFAVG